MNIEYYANYTTMLSDCDKSTEYQTVLKGNQTQ